MMPSARMLVLLFALLIPMVAQAETSLIEAMKSGDIATVKACWA